jgi:integrase
MVNKILEKRNGEFPAYHKSQQNFNKAIKVMGRKAGVTGKLLLEYTQGKRVVRKSYKKYELISSHTARRSFATNAYLAGIPPARIMLITGHRTEQSFFKYICIQKQENAKVLAEHDFFK